MAEKDHGKPLWPITTRGLGKPRCPRLNGNCYYDHMHHSSIFANHQIYRVIHNAYLWSPPFRRALPIGFTILWHNKSNCFRFRKCIWYDSIKLYWQTYNILPLGIAYRICRPAPPVTSSLNLRSNPRFNPRLSHDSSVLRCRAQFISQSLTRYTFHLVLTRYDPYDVTGTDAATTMWVWCV